MGLLSGKKGLIFGALDSHSIAWKVALKAVEEGASITLSNSQYAIDQGKINELAVKCKARLIPADATSVDDLANLMNRSLVIHNGQLDFIFHSVAHSQNMKNEIPYTESDYEFYLKTLDTSAVSFHKMMHIAYQLDAVRNWGSILAVTYIGSNRILPTYGDMGDAKSALESIARSFGYQYGLRNKVRVNTISQSPTYTKAASGVKYFDLYFQFANRISPLGNASADDCAAYCVMMFSDYTRMVTMQNLYNDGGFSNTGVSEKFMELFGN